MMVTLFNHCMELCLANVKCSESVAITVNKMCVDLVRSILKLHLFLSFIYLFMVYSFISFKKWVAGRGDIKERKEGEERGTLDSLHTVVLPQLYIQPESLVCSHTCPLYAQADPGCAPGALC